MNSISTRHPERQLGHADRGTRVPPGVAEHLLEQLRRTVADGGLLIEAGCAVHHHESFTTRVTFERSPISAFSAARPLTHVDARGLVRFLDGDISADLAGDERAVLERSLSGDEDEVACAHGRNVRRDRRDRRREVDARARRASASGVIVVRLLPLPGARARRVTSSSPRATSRRSRSTRVITLTMNIDIATIPNARTHGDGRRYGLGNSNSDPAMSRGERRRR